MRGQVRCRALKTRFFLQIAPDFFGTTRRVLAICGAHGFGAVSLSEDGTS